MLPSDPIKLIDKFFESMVYVLMSRLGKKNGNVDFFSLRGFFSNNVNLLDPNPLKCITNLPFISMKTRGFVNIFTL